MTLLHEKSNESFTDGNADTDIMKYLVAMYVSTQQFSKTVPMPPALVLFGQSIIMSYSKMMASFNKLQQFFRANPGLTNQTLALPIVLKVSAASFENTVNAIIANPGYILVPNNLP